MTITLVEESDIQRLAFIKYLFNLAINQSRQPAPLSSASILTFHDSVELFLQLSSEFLDVGRSGIGFLEYWDVITPRITDGELTQKESMRRLNSARVALKHHGTRPSKFDIETFRGNVSSFFLENTSKIFDLDFESISMVDLVHCAEARGSLMEASTLKEEGNLEEAVNIVAIAFSQLIDDYENRKRSTFGRSPFFFGESLTFAKSFSLRLKGDFAHSYDKVVKSVEAMQEAMKILSLGIEYRRYVKFRELAPSVYTTVDGTRHIGGIRRAHPLTAEEYQYCFDFVIESSLTLSDFDFDIT